MSDVCGGVVQDGHGEMVLSPRGMHTMIEGTIGGMMRKSRAPLHAPKILLYSVDL